MRRYGIQLQELAHVDQLCYIQRTTRSNSLVTRRACDQALHCYGHIAIVAAASYRTVFSPWAFCSKKFWGIFDILLIIATVRWSCSSAPSARVSILCVSVWDSHTQTRSETIKRHFCYSNHFLNHENHVLPLKTLCIMDFVVKKWFCG